MNIVVFFFWLSLGILFYSYVGYGLFVFIVSRVKRLFKPAGKTPGSDLIPVTLVVTAFNERPVLEQKIKNILGLDYPRDLLHIIFVTDGSTDGSVELIRQYPAIKLLHQPGRKGKYVAIKRAMQQVSTPVVLFSDANAELNKGCIRKIVSHYSDPRVGGVAGEKKIRCGEHSSAVGQAEGWYWQYESFMKKLDAGLYTVVGAAGELFSIRTSLFSPLGDDLVLDDFILSMQVCLQGYKIAYEPGAFATEMPSASLAEEEKRKTRIAAGAFQAIGLLRNSLHIFRFPTLTFQYISRRLLRWVFCPLLLLVLLLTNFLIAGSARHAAWYDWILYAQLLFYGMALLGAWLTRKGKSFVCFTIPFYFVFMNYCLVKGFLRFIQGKQTVLWEKSLRQAVE